MVIEIKIVIEYLNSMNKISFSISNLQKSLLAFGVLWLLGCSEKRAISTDKLSIQHSLVREYFLNNSLNPDNLKVSAIKIDKQSNMHVRLEKYWKGIYLWNLGLKVKFDASGKALETDGLFPSADLKINLSDTLARSGALELGENFLKRQELSVPLSSIELDAELVIWAMEQNEDGRVYKPAWYVFQKHPPDREQKILNKLNQPDPKILAHEPKASEFYRKHGNWPPYVVLDARSGSMLLSHTGLKRIIASP